MSKYSKLIGLFTLIILAFSGCKHGSKDSQTLSKIDSVKEIEIIDELSVKAEENLEFTGDTVEQTTSIESKAKEGVLEVSTDSVERNKLQEDESIIQEFCKDIDKNDIIDSVQIRKRSDNTNYIRVIFNGELIFEHEWPELGLLSINTFEYVDFDQDGKDEIYLTVYPNVNSRSLIELLILKQSNGQWDKLNLPLNEIGHNCFPFLITRGKEEFDFIISSEYLEKEIHFDASAYFEDVEEVQVNSIKGYRNKHYKEGDMVAFISAWGIWEAKTGEYANRNCIIAQQAIEGPYGNFLGKVIIYFTYDKDGNLEVLNVEHSD